jgi:hypothetical protein
MNKNMSDKYSIGILGSNGFVGEVMKKYYTNAKGYDIVGECNPLEEVLKQDVVFIAFNLKDNGINSYDKVAEYMKKAPKD